MDDLCFYAELNTLLLDRRIDLQSDDLVVIINFLFVPFVIIICQFSALFMSMLKFVSNLLGALKPQLTLSELLTCIPQQ